MTTTRPVKFIEVNGVKINQNDIATQTAESNGDTVLLKDGTSLFIPKDGNSAGRVVLEDYNTVFANLKNVTIRASEETQGEGCSTYTLNDCETCTFIADENNEEYTDVVLIKGGNNNNVQLDTNDQAEIVNAGPRAESIMVYGKGVMNQNDQLESLDITM